jgi:stage V sporulation protein G
MNLSTVKVERVRLVQKESNVKAFCDVLIGGSYVVKSLRVVDGKKGLFVGLPREKGKEDKYYDIFYPISKEAREELEGAVLKAYEEEKNKEVK